jgi:hypothetical protein
MATVAIENILQPGKAYLRDASKYNAMRQAMLKVLPAKSPGMSVSAINEAVRPLLPQTLFPGGSTVGWWVKTVQLDLEAKEIIRRESTPPVRLHKV